MTLLIEHPEDLRTETLNADETLCRDFFDDVWARGNTDRIDDYLDDHFHWNARPGYDPDRAGYARMVDEMHHAFPDLYGDLAEVVADNGRFAAHWLLEGHHENDWQGIKATGNKVRMEGLVIDTIRNGRCASEYSTGNDLQMFAQLGVNDIGRFSAPAPDAQPHGQPSMWQKLRHPFS